MSFYQDYLKKQNGDPQEVTPEIPEENSVPEKEPEKPLSDEESERKKFLERVNSQQESLSSQSSPSISKPPSYVPDVSSAPIEEATHVSSAPPKSQKIIIRILIILLITSVIACLAAYAWWLAIKTPKIEIEKIVEVKEAIIEIPEIEAPVSLLKYNGFLDPIITQLDEVPVYLGQYIKQEHQENSLTKISFKNQADRLNPSFLSLDKFFTSLKIFPPSGFYEKTAEQDFNLFLYSGKTKDLGFIFPVAENSMNELLGIILGTWDNSFEKDLVSFYSISEIKEESDPASTIHKRANIRCQNFNSGHHLCYAPYNEYFLITTSLESAKAAIDNFR
jgi:flagellar basal body-associated protein FliL